MSGPIRTTILRPGSVSPVFFLSLLAVLQLTVAEQKLMAQPFYWSTGSMARGYSCSSGYAAASLNQAALGDLEKASISLQHSRLFAAGPGLSRLSIQFPSGVGTSVASSGLPGLRYNECWVSSGIHLRESILLGLGLHAWTWSIPGTYLHTPGLSFALGALYQASGELVLGLHLLHPLAWQGGSGEKEHPCSGLAAGLRWECFPGLFLGTELRSSSGRLAASAAAKWSLSEQLGFSLSCSTLPLVLHSGLRLAAGPFLMDLHLAFNLTSGTLPELQLHYEW